MDYGERLRLEEEKHRLSLERERAKEEERRHAVTQEHRAGVEMTRLELEAAPTRTALALTELVGSSVVRQHEAFGQTLNSLLSEEVRQGAALTENLLGKLTDLVQTKLAHKEAARQRDHDRAMAIITRQFDGAQQAANHRHETAMAQQAEIRAAADHGRAMEATAHTAKVDSGKYAEQKVLDFLLWLRAQEVSGKTRPDLSEEELMSYWRKFASEENG